MNQPKTTRSQTRGIPLPSELPTHTQYHNSFLPQTIRDLKCLSHLDILGHGVSHIAALVTLVSGQTVSYSANNTRLTLTTSNII